MIRLAAYGNEGQCGYNNGVDPNYGLAPLPEKPEHEETNEGIFWSPDAEKESMDTSLTKSPCLSGRGKQKNWPDTDQGDPSRGIKVETNQTPLDIDNELVRVMPKLYDHQSRLVAIKQAQEDFEFHVGENCLLPSFCGLILFTVLFLPPALLLPFPVKLGLGSLFFFFSSPCSSCSLLHGLSCLMVIFSCSQAITCCPLCCSCDLLHFFSCPMVPS